MDILNLYAPIERALLSAYLQVPDPQPAGIAGLDVTTPVPDGWNEARDGIGPRASELGSDNLMLENAVARICLESAQRSLPQWAVVRDGTVTLGRRRSRPGRRARKLRPLHLFTINWGDSGPGFSWPEAYHVTWLPGYDVSIVTASADSPDTHGYCDFAIGWFEGPANNLARAADCLTGHWITQKGYCQERWAYLFDAGAFDEAAANALADAVWPSYGDAQ